jgi:hypothetical protein
MKKFTRAGNLSKAVTGDDGSLHLLVLASGPELDKQGERVSKVALGQLVESAKAGEIRLTPSHDVPLTLGKSVDATQDDTGHVTIDFLLAKENPLAVQLHQEVSAGEWADRQVSIGGGCTKQVVYDPDLKKNVPEIATLKANHTALTFPNHAAYAGAALTEALVKAFKAGDKEALKAAGIPEEEIAKAYDASGKWVPSTFASAWASEKLQDELPDMLSCLRWNIETILWVDDSTQKRALLMTTFQEFTTAVLGEMGVAAKSIEPPLDAATLVAEVAKLASGLADIKASVEKLAPPTITIDHPSAQPIAKTEPPPVEEPSPEPAPVRKDVPDTTKESAAAVNAPAAQASETAKDQRETLSKAIKEEADPMRRANMIQQLNALNAQ